jgi:hypothetical protein
MHGGSGSSRDGRTGVVASPWYRGHPSGRCHCLLALGWSFKEQQCHSRQIQGQVSQPFMLNLQGCT